MEITGRPAIDASGIGSRADLPGEEHARHADSDAAYTKLLARLSHQSVVKLVPQFLPSLPIQRHALILLEVVS